ncbi:MAG: type I DNA topoisomerase [Bacteroidales bacterium]|nr:type I DNA topoisomerase [Bacteroidales bacterium]
MEGNLIIVESPAKAKTIQKFLGKDFIVKSSFGHIRDLHDKNLSVDINDGFKPEYVVPAQKQKLVSDLKKAADAVQTVWLASDEDREGEAISWHLTQTLGLDMDRTHRIVFHEITKDAILNAIKNPRSIDMGLVNAQQARRVMDRLVGFELSPILWRKIQKGLSAGRVQSVALRLIVDREREINSFVPEPYYRVEATFMTGGVKVKGLLDTRFKTIEEARTFLSDSIGAAYTVDSVDKKEGVRYPAPPFTTSTLQQEAARKLHFSVSNTMRVAQSLYERGLITYMRTDSTNLSSLALGTTKQFILNNFGPEYQHTRQYKTHTKGAQEAHEAIRPTFIENVEIEGTADETRLYQLIWKRTLASQMSEAKVMNTAIKVASDKRSERYNIQASEILFDGFLKIYMEGVDDGAADAETTTILPEINVGDVMTEKGISADCKYTQPPFRYSEATLVKKLEELGIGRPSTYAPTISTLTTGRGYVVKGNKEGTKVSVTNLTLKGGNITESVKTETIGAEKGKLLPQEIGIIVTDYLLGNFSDIMNYDFTANVEKSFDGIAEGDLKWNEVISDFYAPFHKKVEESLSDRQFNRVEKDLGVDPSSGEHFIAKFGQFGPYVQKGEGDKKTYASLPKGMLIENLTLEDALKLFDLPRIPGQIDGIDVVVLRGRFGPYIKYADKNITLPKGMDPLKVSLEECAKVISAAGEQKPSNTIIAEFKDSDIQILNGRYGPYIKHAGGNYKIPKGTKAETLSEQDCMKIISEGAPTKKKFSKSKNIK